MGAHKSSMKTMSVKSLTLCLAHSRPSVSVTAFLLPLHHCVGLTYRARSAWTEGRGEAADRRGSVGTWAWQATHITVMLPRSGELESEQTPRDRRTVAATLVADIP